MSIPKEMMIKCNGLHCYIMEITEYIHVVNMVASSIKINM